MLDLSHRHDLHHHHHDHEVHKEELHSNHGVDSALHSSECNAGKEESLGSEGDASKRLRRHRIDKCNTVVPVYFKYQKQGDMGPTPVNAASSLEDPEKIVPSSFWDPHSYYGGNLANSNPKDIFRVDQLLVWLARPKFDPYRLGLDSTIVVYRQELRTALH